jgi:type IV secretion system protein VirB8
MLKDLDQDQKEGYFKFINATVEDGSYFKDARDWYIFRYIYPVCERTLLFFIASIAGLVTYILAITIINAFPITQESPVVIHSKDQSVYFPVIKPLKDSIELTTIDEAVIKYLSTKYLQKREAYNFRKFDIRSLNDRLNYIKNNSSSQEYINFQTFLNKSNPRSPILYFGKDFQRSVNIDMVSFPRRNTDDLIKKAKDMLSSQIPKMIDIRYTITNKINSKTSSTEKYLTRLSFTFSGVQQESQSKLNFNVTSYKTYNLK